MDFPFAFAPVWKIIKISVAFVAELKKKSCFFCIWLLRFIMTRMLLEFQLKTFNKMMIGVNCN